MDQCLGIWQWSFHAPYPSRRLGTGKRSALRRAAPRPARARNQAGHSKSLQQETTVQLQQAYLQAALAHRERVQQIEGLQAHRNPLRQAGAKLSGLCLPRRCSCMVDLMSLDPNIATEAVVRAPADGYTLLLVTAANAINTTLYEKLNFSFIRDIAPVAGIMVVPNVMLVHPSVPAKTVPEFIAYAKANPGKINIASGPIGGPSHVTAELYKMMTGTDMLLVSYRGVAPAATDLLGGQVQVMFNSVPASIEYIRAGKLRALAVASATRSETLPGIPTMGEF